MANTINLLNFLFDDVGNVLGGLTVEAFATTTLGSPTTTAYATGTYNASGRWQLDSLDDTLLYESKETLSSQVRRQRGAQKLQVQEMAVSSALKMPDGVVGAPGLAFLLDPDTGLYRPSSNRLALAVGGVKALDVSPTMFDFSTFDLNLGSGKNVRVNDANPWRTMVLTAGGGWPSTTNGCAAVVLVESTTNKENTYRLDFPPSVDRYAEWTVVMPDNWDGSSIYFYVIWTASGGATGRVYWTLQARAYGDNAAVDQAWGAVGEIVSPVRTYNEELQNYSSGLVTIAGTPAGGQLVQFRLCRQGSSVSDTLTAANARLLALKIGYGINAFSD